MGSFGEKLRKQREHRGLSLDAISTTTKISTRMLRAIEDEHFDQLPGGVFNKGFVRAYARHVGLDEEEAITDYLAALRESQVQSQTILPSLRAPSRRPAPDADEPDPHHHDGRTQDVRTDGRTADARTEDRRIHHDRRVEARRSQDRHSEDRQSKDRQSKDRTSEDGLASRSQPSPVETHLDEDLAEPLAEDLPSRPTSFLNLEAAPKSSQPIHSEALAAESTPAAGPSPRVRWERLAIPLLVIVIALAAWALYRRNHPDSASRPTTLSQPVAASQPVPFSSPAAPPALAVTASAVKPSAVTGSLKPSPTGALPTKPTPTHPTTTPPSPDAKPPVAPPQAQVATPKPPPTFTLVIRAAQTSWVAIVADGQPVAHETLFAPAATSVKASREIVVRAGNAAGVSFVLNGKEFPAEGNPGEVRVYTFDATGLRDTSLVQPAPSSH